MTDTLETKYQWIQEEKNNRACTAVAKINSEGNIRRSDEQGTDIRGSASVRHRRAATSDLCQVAIKRRLRGVRRVKKLPAALQRRRRRR